MKIYMVIKDADNITIDNIFLVTKQYDAEKLVACGEAQYYEIMNTLNSVDVDNIYQTKIAKG